MILLCNTELIAKIWKKVNIRSSIIVEMIVKLYQDLFFSDQ